MTASPNVCDTLLKGIVVTMDPERKVYTDGYVAVAGSKVVAVGRASNCEFRAKRTLGGPEWIILPGLINCHTHLIKGCIRGMAEGTGFEERLFGCYFPMTGACDEARSYTAAMTPILELLTSGVTTTQDCQYTHRDTRSIDGVLAAVRDAGIRCRMARLIVNDVDAVPADFRESVGAGLTQVERLRHDWTSERITVTTGSLGITYVSENDLREIWDWTVEKGEQMDMHLPTHMDTVYFPSRRGWDGGSFEWLAKKGMLGPNLIAAHALHLRAGEHELVAENQVKVAAIPGMNLLQGAVRFDIRSFVERAVDVGLGLDGPVVSYDQNLWISMREAIIGQRLSDRAREMIARETLEGNGAPFGSAELALEMATIGGARALGLSDRVGSLEPGKEADAVLIDASEAVHLSPKGAALIPNLVYGGGANPRFVKHVLVGGDLVVEDGQSTRVDARAAVHDADSLQKVLVNETGTQRYVRAGTTWTWTDG